MNEPTRFILSIQISSTVIFVFVSFLNSRRSAPDGWEEGASLCLHQSLRRATTGVGRGRARMGTPTRPLRQKEYQDSRTSHEGHSSCDFSKPTYFISQKYRGGSNMRRSRRPGKILLWQGIVSSPGPPCKPVRALYSPLAPPSALPRNFPQQQKGTDERGSISLFRGQAHASCARTYHARVPLVSSRRRKKGW